MFTWLLMVLQVRVKVLTIILKALHMSSEPCCFPESITFPFPHFIPLQKDCTSYYFFKYIKLILIPELQICYFPQIILWSAPSAHPHICSNIYHGNLSMISISTYLFSTTPCPLFLIYCSSLYLSLPDILLCGFFLYGLFTMIDGKFHESKGFYPSCLPLQNLQHFATFWHRISAH